MTEATIRAPFPWFGGKSSVADEVWQRFGAVKNYVEPFFGSGACLLARPNPDGFETINDFDGLLANVWRSLQAGFTPFNWKARGGYGNQGDGRGRENAKREVIWFSPHCLSGMQNDLFAEVETC